MSKDKIERMYEIQDCIPNEVQDTQLNTSREILERLFALRQEAREKLIEGQNKVRVDAINDCIEQIYTYLK